jgi:DNA invertase Pin-like site-specific DNA recombinase
LEAQRADIQRYCELYKLELVEIICEEGSGKNLKDRPGLQRALAMLGSEAAGLVITKLDRLTRSVRDLATLLEHYFDAGSSLTEPAILASVGEQIDTRSPAGRLMLHILASVSQWEREVIGERTRRGLKQRQAEGVVLGRPCFGKQNDEQAVVARVLQYHEAGQTIRGIVQSLRAEGMISTSGKPIGIGQVHRIVSRAVVDRVSHAG